MPLAIREIWRFPIKSLRGQALPEVELGADGIQGDRLVHVREPGGRVVTARFRPGLLGLQGGLADGGMPLVEGRPWDSAEALELVRAASARDVSLVPFDGHDHGQRFDVLPLTVLSDGMIQSVGVGSRRFRANLVLGGASGLQERDWVGRALRIGEVLIGVKKARFRCVMTTFDPDDLSRNPAVLRHIVENFGGHVALDCWVLHAGRIAVGQNVEVVELPDGTVVPEGNARAKPRRDSE